MTSATDWSQAPVRALAYLGDAVYELHVRGLALREAAAQVEALHKATVARVSAPSQAQLAQRLLPHLSEQEAAIFRRGRNHKGASGPRHASAHDYRLSTALEAVLGYVYLTQDGDRLAALLALTDHLMEDTPDAP
ncbi:MAG: ribonuclease III domain-containing protein [Candidatus Sericytochromatia bacterium]|nr:ribonuclease III domain-containing protein [Candidatus Sericytochromatia bacterium]